MVCQDTTSTRSAGPERDEDLSLGAHGGSSWCFVPKRVPCELVQKLGWLHDTHVRKKNEGTRKIREKYEQQWEEGKEGVKKRTKIIRKEERKKKKTVLR